MYISLFWLFILIISIMWVNSYKNRKLRELSLWYQQINDPRYRALLAYYELTGNYKSKILLLRQAGDEAEVKKLVKHLSNWRAATAYINGTNGGDIPFSVNQYVFPEDITDH